MKTKYSFIFCFFFLSSCFKSVNNGNGDSTAENLAYYQWHLISCTNSNPSIQRYIGTSADSVRFTWKWANNGNFSLDSIYSYIGGSLNKYSVTGFNLDAVNIYSRVDSINISPNWKTGYTNHLFVNQVDGNFTTAIIKINSLDGSSVEIDSLKR